MQSVTRAAATNNSRLVIYSLQILSTDVFHHGVIASGRLPGWLCELICSVPRWLGVILVVLPTLKIQELKSPVC